MPKQSKPGAAPQPGQPISLRTLGEYLNLSPATISLVLNNAPGVRSIPQDTRDRVIEAAAKFDYRPSFYARSLRKRQTFTVGVLVPELSDSYAMQVLSGVEEHLIEEGYFYLTASHRRKPDLIEEYPRLFIDRSVEGFVFIDTALEKSLGFSPQSSLPAIARSKASPMLSSTRSAPPNLPCAISTSSAIAKSHSCAAAATAPTPTIAGIASWPSRAI